MNRKAFHFEKLLGSGSGNLSLDCFDLWNPVRHYKPPRTPVFLSMPGCAEKYHTSELSFSRPQTRSVVLLDPLERS